METMINRDLNGNQDQKGRGSQDYTGHKELKKDERMKTKKVPFGWQCSSKEHSTDRFHGEKKAYSKVYAW